MDGASQPSDVAFLHVEQTHWIPASAGMTKLRLDKEFAGAAQSRLCHMLHYSLVPFTARDSSIR